MEEHRKAKRIPFQMSLEVSNLFKQADVQIRDLNAPIEICNISKTGIGFQTKSILPLNYYFNATLRFDRTNEILKCVVRIVREQKKEDGMNFYGCEFVGMASIFNYMFDEQEEEYEKSQSEKDQSEKDQSEKDQSENSTE